MLGETDLRRWRLKVDEGRQTWHYVDETQAAAAPQSTAEKYFTGQPLDDVPALPPAQTPLEAARNGYAFFRRLQLPDGHWACEYGGPLFLLPGLVIAMYVTHTRIPAEWATEITRYICHHVNADGGWGLHTAGHSTAFGTCMNYVTLRILGMDATHPVAERARVRLHALGSATAVPSWAKFWLAVLNCYDWRGMNPVPPELWLLPNWVPFHPWRWWCHTRAVYLPMGFVYSRRATGEVTALVESLRHELYTQPYEEIDWPKQANNVARADVYHPHSLVLDTLNLALRYTYPWRPKWLQRAAERRALQLVELEDANTDYLCIGPVNKALHLLVAYFAFGAESEQLAHHRRRLVDFMWVSERGMMMNGTNGVQLWDTAFAAQALAEARIARDPENRESVERALEYLDVCQIREPCFMNGLYRQSRVGAWPFSTRHQGYTVSDCTAEALKAVVQLQQLLPARISTDRLRDAVDVLLTMQNSDGGFASYERIRGPTWLELLNVSEVFGRIMREYNYPECTTSVVIGLTHFASLDPTYRPEDVSRTIARAVAWIKSDQAHDGSWYGSWGICYTYGALFATEALAVVGETFSNSTHQSRACQFILSKQRADGGWGESYKSSELHEYSQSESQVVNTAWACISLMNAKYPDKEPIKRGIELIMARQQPQGDWKQEQIEGVFNGNCMISYPNYKFVFSIKALGMYAHYWGDYL